jgi:hypothetical protein
MTTIDTEFETQMKALMDVADQQCPKPRNAAQLISRADFWSQVASSEMWVDKVRAEATIFAENHRTLAARLR